MGADYRKTTVLGKAIWPINGFRTDLADGRAMSTDEGLHIIFTLKNGRVQVRWAVLRLWRKAVSWKVGNDLYFWWHKPVENPTVFERFCLYRASVPSSGWV